MKKLTTLLLSLLFSAISFAQSFQYSGGAEPIPYNSDLNIPISVSGVPFQINPTWGISEVTISLTHTWVSDLKISLLSPSGTVVILSLHNGNTGANYTNTVFRMDGVNGHIINGTAPFTGQYIPDQSLNTFNNNQNPNGTWQIVVLDEFPTSSGTFLSGELKFSNNPPPDPASSNLICSTTNAAGCICADTSLNDCDLFPDLICSHVVLRDGWNEAPGAIDFPNAIIDIGHGPLEMKPTGNCYCDTLPVPCTTVQCPNGTYPKERVSERVYHKNANGTMTYTDYPAGNQSFHPGHGHVHAEDFFQFALRIPTTNPDPLTWPIVGSSIKTGYCLVNMGDCNSQDSICMSHGNVITNANIPNLNLGSVSGCGNQGQGLFTGRYDIYSSGFGQVINVPNICNGDYYIVVNVDPFNHFIEEDETNNVVAVPVHLTQQPGSPLNASFVYAFSGNATLAFFNYTAGITNYIWDFGDGTTSSAAYPTHTYTSTGYFTVTLTISNGICSTSSAQVIYISPLSIDEVESGISEIKVSPNPTKGPLSIEYILTNITLMKIELFDVIGKKVMTVFEGNNLAGKHQVKVDDLNAGTYFVKLTANDKTFTEKIVKL